MREVKVRRDDLLQKVVANRDKHISEYRESVDGYKAAAKAAIRRAVTKLERDIDELESGQVRKLGVVQFDLQVPQDHTKDYDQVIQMLSMCVDEVITVRSDEFACYVMDDWEWRNEFENTKSLYTNRR